MKLPIIDFTKCAITLATPGRAEMKNVGGLVYDAFANVGFVYLKNVGIHRNEVERVLSVSKQFFDLDFPTKEKYNIDKECFGYVGVGVEKNNVNRPGDFKENYDVVSTDCASTYSKWPDREVPMFSKEFRSFSTSCRLLAGRILSVLSLGMQVKDPDYFLRCHSRMNGVENLSSLRSLYYPPLPANEELLPDQVRLGEHTDFGSFTILFQGTHGGLQVRTTKDTYIDAEPIPNTVLVNVGDALQFWTRGKLRSTEHRILKPKSAEENVERRSLAYFVQADNEVVLDEVEYERSGTHKARADIEVSKSPTVIEYLTEQYKSINLGQVDD